MAIATEQGPLALAAEHAAMGGELTSFTDLALAARALPQLKDAGTPPTKLFDFANLSGIPIWLDGLYANGSTRPAVVLWFDNWWDQYGGGTYANHHQYIKPILDRYGWKCGITVPLDEYGVGKNTSVAVMQQMHDEGHDIILNDVSNPGFTTSGRSLAQIKADIATTRATLAAQGWYRGNKIWCLNQNETSKDLRALLSANGVELARAGGAERRFVQLELGVEDALNFGSNSMDKVTSSDCQELMTRTINYGAVSHMYWHLFRTGGTANGTAPAESLTSWVEAFADFAAALRVQELAGNIDVLSPTQYNIRRKAFGSLI